MPWRVGAHALTRVCLAAAAAGCASPPAGAAALSAGDTVAGRAALGSRIALLTSEPALITADLDLRTLRRTPIARRAGEPNLWGLGESGGVLHSIAGFSELVRIAPDGSARHTARFQHAMGNLIDTAAGMAAQRAVDNAGTPLAWHVDTSAGLSPMAGPPRQSLGMSRAEEGALHLLSCSAPPAVVCWLPGSNELLTIDRNQVFPVARIDTVMPIAPARLIAEPSSRAIQDAVPTGRGTYIVLFREYAQREQTVMGEFGARGERLRVLAAPEPLRLLLGVRDGLIVAIARSGRLVGVPL
ncbi:MAG TPA: hypothetical protein VMN81_09140 [Vicinamibacterales bacterium]|nr:hypothetical protein [Vicinamibacterales bacterium]